MTMSMAGPPSVRGDSHRDAYRVTNTSIPVLVASAAALGVLAIARSRPFRVEVAGWSMEPTLLPGDYLIATKASAVRRGMLIVLHRPGPVGFELVKRVAGLPGDVVDGRRLRFNEYWVLGDRPDRSTDSRVFGPVTAVEIEGVVRLRYWPLSRAAWFSPA